MKKILFTLFIAIIIVSCEKYPGPINETLKYFNAYPVGNSQIGIGGEYLEQSVGARITIDLLKPVTNKSYRLEIQVTSGNGSVDQETVNADTDGTMTTRWKLGDDINEQSLQCRILDSDDQLYYEFTISATAFLSDKLNVLKDGPLIGIQDMVRDTLNQRSMILSGGNLYVSTDKFYDWEMHYYPYISNIKELEINSKQEIFAATYSGELFRTNDWGITWYNLGKPIPGNEYYFELSISKDDYLWANKSDYGVFCSKDKGLTWTKDTTGLIDQEQLSRVFCFGDTSHIALSYSQQSIIRTDDNGISWYPVNTPEYSQTIYISDNNTIITQNQNGFTLNKSSDEGQSYKQVFRTYTAFGTTSDHCYDHFRDEYYVLAPGGGVWKTKNFEEFEELMTFTLQRNLFIDHKGNIYACGRKYSNAADEPTLILPASE